jgi:integrase
MKQLVANLEAKGLSAQTIKHVFLLVQKIKASETDSEGTVLYPTPWNKDYIDMPVVEQTDEPSFLGDQVTQIVQLATGRFQMVVILFAATGMRMEELLGLECRHFDESSVRIEQAVWNYRLLPRLKTPSSKRTIDLCPPVAGLLREYIGDRRDGYIFRTSSGKPLN